MRIADVRSPSEEPASSSPTADFALIAAFRNPRWRLPVLLSLLYLVTLAYIGRTHTFGTYATETDFYHLYAPDAERIAAWQFPENPYQGPGYPAVVALVAKLTGDVFVAGKWISIVSAALVSLLTFFLFARMFGDGVGSGAQLIVMVSGQFPQFAINAATDVFFLLLCLAALVILMSDRIGVRWRVALAAVCASLAYLTRYNGLFLLAACLLGIMAFNLFKRHWRERLGLAAIFVVVFVIIASPWLYANYRHRGSPFYNTNYLNAATEFYGDLVGGRTNQDGTRELEHVFHSFGEVLRYNPQRILTRYPVNLYDSLRRSVTTDLVSPWVGWFAVVGCLLVLVERRSKAALLLLVSGVIYWLLMGLNHWETRYYFLIMVIYAGLAVYAVFRLLELLRRRGWLTHRAYTLIPIALVMVMWSTSLAYSKQDVQNFLASHPTEVLSACDYLKRAQVSGARIMSRKPHLPFICHQQWVFIPQVKSLDELRAWIEIHPVDYIAIGSIEVSRRRELAALKDPRTAPPWLKAVWVNPNPAYILYKVEVGQGKS